MKNRGSFSRHDFLLGCARSCERRASRCLRSSLVPHYQHISIPNDVLARGFNVIISLSCMCMWVKIMSMSHLSLNASGKQKVKTTQNVVKEEERRSVVASIGTKTAEELEVHVLGNWLSPLFEGSDMKVTTARFFIETCVSITIQIICHTSTPSYFANFVPLSLRYTLGQNSIFGL